MATIGKGSEYALHCLLYLIDLPVGASLTISDLAEFQGVSQSYLAKIFTKLKKAGLVSSSIGSKGGFELARSPENISLLDVVMAVEGEINFFECRNILAETVIYRDTSEKPNWLASPCEIHKIMLQAEASVRTVLANNTLASLSRDVGKKLSREEMETISHWFRERCGQ
jgi:Rrf2 family protein